MTARATKQGSLSRLSGALTATVAAVLMAAPWIVPSLVWCGWIGVAIALRIATTGSGRARFGWPAYAVLLALVLAFHWAPQTLASQMQVGYAVGLVAFLPLLALDVVRAALPFWWVSRIGVSTAAAWLPAGCCAVVAEALVPTVFPWRYGYGQLAWPWTIQLADAFGAPGLTLLVFAHAGAVLVLIEAARRVCFQPDRASTRPLGWIAWLSVALPVANAAYGAYAVQHWKAITAQAPKLSVALVQVEPGLTKSVPTMRRLTRQVSGKVDLVCWPESSAGNYAADLDSFADAQAVFQHSRDPDRGLRPWPAPDGSLLCGATIYEGDRDRPSAVYQAAILIDSREQRIGSYRKRYLMPFGEFVPCASWLPRRRQVSSGSEEFVRGDRANVLPVAAARIGVMLCYEDMLPHAAASLVQNSANLLVSLINGSAFETPLTRHQHRMLAQLRSVENRRYLLRCAATGETCVVSPWGTVESRLPLEGDGVLTANAALLESRTWARFGSIGLVALCGVGVILFWTKRNTAASVQ